MVAPPRVDSLVEAMEDPIDLTVALINPEPWGSLLESFEKTLRFLSGDYWTIHAIEGGVEPEFRGEIRDIDADCVCLLSGGTDSLIGAIDLVEQGHNPIYISRTVRGDCEAQRRFAHTLGVPENHYQWGCSIKRPRGMSEPSTRARSLVFFAFAIIAASAFDETGAPIPIIVPENGFISLNIPMTPSRIGSLSTKTTHPIYMEGIQMVMDALGINAQLQLLYRFKTKGEMIVECRNQTVLRELIDDSISCGKYRRHGYKHCGVCVPCLVRRAAYLRAGIEDNTRKGYDITPSQHCIPEDTMAAACAIIRKNQEGIKSLTSGALVFSVGEDRVAYEDVFSRGLDQSTAGIEQIIHQQIHIGVFVGKAGENVFPGGVKRAEAAGNGGGSFLCCRAGDAHFLLDFMNGLENLIKGNVLDGFRCHLDGIPQDAGIVDKAGHFFLCAAIAQLQIVQHCIVVFCKSLVGVLNRSNVCTKFIGVVGHVLDGHVSHAGGRLRVSVQSLQQAGREACDGLHIFIGRHASCAEGCVCIVYHGLRICSKNGVHAAQELLCVRVFCNDALGKIDRHRCGLLARFIQRIAQGNSLGGDGGDVSLKGAASLAGLLDPGCKFAGVQGESGRKVK